MKFLHGWLKNFGKDLTEGVGFIFLIIAIYELIMLVGVFQSESFLAAALVAKIMFSTVLISIILISLLASILLTIGTTRYQPQVWSGFLTMKYTVAYVCFWTQMSTLNQVGAIGLILLLCWTTYSVHKKVRTAKGV